MGPIRLFATAPKLPFFPFASMAGWKRWLHKCVSKCLSDAGPGCNVVVLPEMSNLTVITTGWSPSMILARICIRLTKLAMLLAGGQLTIKDGLPGVMRAQAHKLEQSLEMYQEIARENRCYLVASGFYLEGVEQQLVNRLWVIDPTGVIVHIYDKQQLTPEEEEMGVKAGPHADPFFEIEGHRLAAVICFDMFDAEIQSQLKSADVEALIVPSANPRPWAGYAESGVWQPAEWLTGSDWLLESETVFVGSMMCGRYSASKFEGQAFIRGQRGTQPCSFPTDGKCTLPETGFYPWDGDVIYVDLSS